jgi:hypothetical protein
MHRGEFFAEIEVSAFVQQATDALDHHLARTWGKHRWGHYIRDRWDVRATSYWDTTRPRPTGPH